METFWHAAMLIALLTGTEVWKHEFPSPDWSIQVEMQADEKVFVLNFDSWWAVAFWLLMTTDISAFSKIIILKRS